MKLFQGTFANRIVPAGTTIYSMSVKDNNDKYEFWADKYDIHFIFDDNIPSIDFYSIPQIDIMAVDSPGGFLGTSGETSDIDNNMPICYIDHNRNCFIIASNNFETTGKLSVKSEFLLLLPF